MQKTLYILISNQLNPLYGAVQGGHAIAQWMIDNPNQDWDNHRLIYLSANLDKWKFRLETKDYNFSTFHEPDLGNQLTAIAIQHDGSVFRNLKLLGS